MSQPLVLIDGSSYLFRAFYVPALARMTSPSGQPTGAIYGVLNMIKSLRDEYNTDQFAVVFDAKGPTFRNDLYDQYKANRPPMPEELRVQIEPLHRIIQAMGIPLLCIPGVEADDVLGTLATHATEQGQETFISTGDKDMAQLVNEHITLINTMDKKAPITDIPRVSEKFGVRPDQIIDYLALMGDTSDNIPGVPKVGPKTAAKWLTQYDTLENLIAHADEIKGKVGESLRDHLAQLPLAKQLTTIKCDVELEVALDELKIGTRDIDVLREEFTNQGFRTWLKQLDYADDNEVAEGPTTPAIETDYQCVLTQEAWSAVLEELHKAEVFAFDTETTSLNYMQAEIVGISVSTESGKGYYIPFTHDYENAPKQLNREQVLSDLTPLLQASPAKVIGQNLKYDWHILKNHGIELTGIKMDTMLASYALNSTATRHNMDDMAEFYLNVKTTHFEDIAGKGKSQKTFNQIELEPATHYAAEDADITLRLYHHLNEALSNEPSLQALLNNLEMPLMPVIAEVEHTGVYVSAELLNQHSQELAKKIAAVQTQAHDMAGEAFNLDSPKQIREIFFDKLELPVIKKTPKGEPSTDEEVLTKLSEDYPLPKLILEYRGMKKLKTTYTDALPEVIQPKTGRVHTSYHQAVTATGRLSSSEPNLQNIPVRNAEGRRVRQAFTAGEGQKILAADYSQIELRIMAHLSGDAGLLNAFTQGEDIHQATAAEIFGITPIEVTSEQRRGAKAINFGLIYGMSAFGLAKQLNVARNEAQTYIDLYFERYPGVLDYMERSKQFAREHGYVETLAGRRLYLPDIGAKNRQRREYAERSAINAPMQGTAADIIKRAMLAVHQGLNTGEWDARMIMQVHDELVFEVAESQVPKFTQALKGWMENAMDLKAPLLVEVGVGDNWDQAH